MEPTPLQVSSYTHPLYKVQDPFSACRQSPFRNSLLIAFNFDEGPVFAHKSNSGREFTGWNQLLCRSVLTLISCTKFKIHSAHADSPRSETAYLLLSILTKDQSLLTNQTQEENLLAGTKSFAAPSSPTHTN